MYALPNIPSSASGILGPSKSFRFFITFDNVHMGFRKESRHGVFDTWMARRYPTIPWCRYADDGLAHCETEEKAQQLLASLEQRFRECGLELHPDKTKIIYCKDSNRCGNYLNKEFTFSGYTFRPRESKNKWNKLFISFSPAVSKAALKSMCAKTRKEGLRNRTDFSIRDLSKLYNPVLRGWYEYYGRYNLSSLDALWRHFNKTLVAWAMRKYKKLKGKTKAMNLLGKIAKEEPHLFIHWEKGIVGSFA